MTGRVPTIVAAALGALAISGCSSQVALDDPGLPEPLLTQLPLTVAVRYSAEMDDYSYEEEVLGRERWTIRLGAANKLLFRHLFDAMFSEVVELGPGSAPEDAGVDALIEASIEAFEFALPAQSRTDAYTVWIRYRLRVFDAEGAEISNWPISAYGKAASESNFGSGDALKRAAVLAMRDAAAMVGMRFARETGLGNPGSAIPDGDPDAAGTDNQEPLNAGAQPPPAGNDADDGPDDTVEPSDSEQPADVAANTTQGNFADDRG